MVKDYKASRGGWWIGDQGDDGMSSWKKKIMKKRGSCVMMGEFLDVGNKVIMFNG